MIFILIFHKFSKREQVNQIAEVQPLTGIAFWWTNEFIDTDAIALEFSYLGFNEVVREDSTYDWTTVDKRLVHIHISCVIFA